MNKEKTKIHHAPRVLPCFLKPSFLYMALEVVFLRPNFQNHLGKEKTDKNSVHLHQNHSDQIT